MIRGIGIDICEISRMEESMTHPRFLERFFTEGERAYIESKNRVAAQSAAGIFAAKEAFVKALGTGIASFRLADIEICHKENGEPYYHIQGEYRQRMDAVSASGAFLSITHDAGVAAAVCVLEG